MNKETRKEFGTVTTAIDVSFAVDETDYGTIHVPVGTKVEQIVISRKSHISGLTVENKSGWFVYDPASVTPTRLMINGRPMHMYLHDAIHRGIRVPAANVKIDKL